MQFSKDVALISKHFRLQRNRYMESLGLKGIHARMLIDVCEQPGISQDRLAQLIGIDKSNVARQVAVLEEQGLLLRKSCGEDKRVLRLHPTQKTLELLPDLQIQTRSWEDNGGNKRKTQLKLDLDNCEVLCPANSHQLAILYTGMYVLQCDSL